MISVIGTVAFMLFIVAIIDGMMLHYNGVQKNNYNYHYRAWVQELGALAYLYLAYLCFK